MDNFTNGKNFYMGPKFTYMELISLQQYLKNTIKKKQSCRKLG